MAKRKFKGNNGGTMQLKASDNLSTPNAQTINNACRRSAAPKTEVERLAHMYITSDKGLRSADRMPSSDPEFVYMAAEDLCSNFTMGGGSLSSGRKIADIYDKSPSLFEGVRVQKDLVKKHIIRNRISAGSTELYEKVVKVLIKGRESSKIASQIIEEFFPVTLECTEGDSTYLEDVALSVRFSTGYYLNEYCFSVIKKFPELKNGVGPLGKMMRDSDETLYDMLLRIHDEVYGQCSGRLETKGDTKVNNAKFKLDSPFYDSVLATMEAFAADPVLVVERLCGTFLRFTDFFGDRAVDAYQSAWEATFSLNVWDDEGAYDVPLPLEDDLDCNFIKTSCSGQRILYRQSVINPEFDKDIRFYGASVMGFKAFLLKQVIAIAEKEQSSMRNLNLIEFLCGPDLMDLFPSKNEKQNMPAEEDMESTDGDVKFAVTPMVALEKHLFLRMYQFMQMSGEIGIRNLMSSNIIKGKDVKHLVNSVFVSYQRLNGKPEPETNQEKMDFMGMILDAYLVRILIMDRSYTMESYYNLLNSSGENTKDKTSENREKEHLLQSNRDLLKENDLLQKRIDSLEADEEKTALKNEIKRLRSAIQELKQDINDYQTEMAEISKERSAAEELLRIYEENSIDSAGTLEEPETTEETFRRIINEKRVMLWGVRDDAIKEYESKYPGLTAVGCEATLSHARMSLYDCVIARVDFCNHGSFWNLKETCSREGIPLRILTKGKTSDKHLWNSVCQVFGKLQ